MVMFHSFVSYTRGYTILVGGLEHEWIMTFHNIGTTTPTDYYFSEGLKPPTSYNSLMSFLLTEYDMGI
jgi:hypothetical protein